MCASAVSMVSIHPHSRCKLKRPGVPLYAACCMLYAVSVRVSVPPSKAANSAVEGPSGGDVCFAV